MRWFKVTVLIAIVSVASNMMGWADDEAQLEHVPFEEVAIHPDCFPFDWYVRWPGRYHETTGLPSLPEELIIQSDPDYQRLLAFKREAEESNCEDIESDVYRSACSYDQQCDQLTLPPIDFSQKTLLGKAVYGSCAARGFKKTLTRDSQRKTYRYRIEVESLPFAVCNGPGLFSMNWVTVPKIPPDYTVRFEPPAQERRSQ